MNAELRKRDGWRGYRRNDFIGDILYNFYDYGEVEALLRPGGAMARDNRVNEWKKRGWVDGESGKKYDEALAALFTQQAEQADWEFNECREKVLRLRNRILGPEQTRRIHILEAEEGIRDSGDGIRQDVLEKQVFADCPVRIVWLADTRYREILTRDLEEYPGKGWYFLTSEDGLYPSEALLSDMGLLKYGETVRAQSRLELESPSPELAEALDAGKALLLVYGDEGLYECSDLKLHAVVRTVPASFIAKALAGRFLKSGLCRIVIPEGTGMRGRVPLRSRTMVSYALLADLCGREGAGIYSLSTEELYRRYPAEFFSVYDEEDSRPPEGVDIVLPESENPIAAFMRERDRILTELGNSMDGVEILSGWFDTETFTRREIPWEHTGPAEGILVHGAILDKAARSEVILAKGSSVSPRTVLHERHAPGGDGCLISNFLFFMTPRIAYLYNMLREKRVREKIDFDGGHMDYMLLREAGARTETVPLYRKACMALKEDGSFLFFHYRLGAGKLTLGGARLEWKRENVDPEVIPENAVCVWTPYLSRDAEQEETYGYTRTVGGGRLNLVLIQDRLIAVRMGDVLLPSIGIVVSLPPESGRAFIEKCDMTEEDDGYYSWKELKPEFSLEKPDEVSEEDWKQVKWAFGGGLSLITKGESIFEKEDREAFLSREGWLSPLSRQTQESKIHELSRHPRTAVGITKAGRFFVLVYSGRIPLSTGADYIEMSRIAKRLIPDVMEMMNVDGGGSSVLGLGIGERFIEMSYPSASNSSVAGMSRPINTILYLKT